MQPLSIIELGLGGQLKEQVDAEVEERKKKTTPPVPENAFGANLMSNAVTDLGITPK